MYIGTALMMLADSLPHDFPEEVRMGAVGFTFIITVLSVQINILLAAYLTPNSGSPTIDSLDGRNFVPLSSPSATA